MTRWFNKSNIKILPTIKMNDINGYVLPHAGTEHSGKILSHTLRFRPTKDFKYILIIYLPSNKQPNMGYLHHEYGVIYNTLRQIKEFRRKIFIGHNIISPESLPNDMNSKNTLYIVSADFSHFLPMQPAINKENCAAHTIMHRNLTSECSKIIDHRKSFDFMYKLIPSNWILQWVGRTRSMGERGVGYLSFLIREPPNLIKNIPNGFFITAYDKDMRSRECLGNTKKWTLNLENNLLKDVIQKAKTTSRLTGGQFTNIPITNYSITYLYRTKHTKFIRGWYAILKKALYLPDVFLENTYENGKWIEPTDTKWEKNTLNTKFNLKYTFNKLKSKASKYMKTRYNINKNSANKTIKNNSNYKLFETHVYHGKINHSSGLGELGLSE